MCISVQSQSSEQILMLELYKLKECKNNAQLEIILELFNWLWTGIFLLGSKILIFTDFGQVFFY